MIVTTYGGTTFAETSIRGFSTEPVSNGPDYLWTKRTIHLRVLLSLAPLQTFVGWDNQNIAQYFKPRQDLTITVNKETWLSVKPPDYNWGPHVLYANVVQVVGPRKAFVDVGFEVCVGKTVGQAKVNKDSQPILLSNRWSMTESIDNRQWVTRIVQGRAIFNATRIEKKHPVNTLYPLFFQPVPFGYKRDAIQITMAPDGLGVAYSYLDRQVPYVTIPRAISDVVITVSGSASQPSSDDVANDILDMANTAIATGAQVAGGNYIDFSHGQTQAAPLTGKNLPPLGSTGVPLAGPPGVNLSPGGGSGGGGGGMGIGKAGALLSKALSMVLKSIPRIQFQVQATVYGFPQAPMDELHEFASYCVIRRIGVFPNPDTLDFVQAASSADARQRVVQYTAVVARSGVKTGLKHSLQALVAKFSMPAARDYETYMRAALKPKLDSLENAYTKATSTAGHRPAAPLLLGSLNLRELTLAALSVAEGVEQDQRILYFQ